MASKVPATAGFVQPKHGQGGNTTAKNKANVPTTQPNHGTGKTSAKKNPANIPFTQKQHGKGGTSSKKNPATASFDQPMRAGKTVAVPKASGTPNVGPKVGKAKKPGAPAPKFTSLDQVTAFRKGKYGV